MEDKSDELYSFSPGINALVFALGSLFFNDHFQHLVYAREWLDAFMNLLAVWFGLFVWQVFSRFICDLAISHNKWLQRFDKFAPILPQILFFAIAYYVLMFRNFK